MKSVFRMTMVLSLFACVAVFADHHEGEGAHGGEVPAALKVAHSNAIALADAVELLDERLHELGKDGQAELVHEMEAVVIDFVGLLSGPATQGLINQGMREVYNTLMPILRNIGTGASYEAETARRVRIVRLAYNDLFYSIYPPQPCTPCGGRVRCN